METPVFPFQECRRGDLHSVRTWLRSGGNIGEPLLRSVAETWTPLMLACAEGDVRLVRAIIEIGGARPSATISTKVLASSTPLHVASRYGRAGVVGVLLELGAVADARDTLGLTPLMLAAGHGHLKTIEALLGAGADSTITTTTTPSPPPPPPTPSSSSEGPGGATALDMAEMAGFDDAAALLRSRTVAGEGRGWAANRSALASWLGALGCEEFLGRFLRAGYDDLQFMASEGLTEADLDCVGVPKEKLGLRKKLMAMHGVGRFLDAGGGGSTAATAETAGGHESESENESTSNSEEETGGSSEGDRDDSDDESEGSGSDEEPRSSDDDASSGSGSDRESDDRGRSGD